MSRAKQLALHYENVYRAHVTPPVDPGLTAVDPELTVFVEASSREAAWQKIRSLFGDGHDVYNVHSAEKLVAEGESEDPELRLFEVGWDGSALLFCEHPVFVVSNPGDWARKWAAAIERAPISARGIGYVLQENSHADSD
jgi:hypothetical protein